MQIARLAVKGGNWPGILTEWIISLATGPGAAIRIAERLGGGDGSGEGDGADGAERTGAESTA